MTSLKNILFPIATVVIFLVGVSILIKELFLFIFKATSFSSDLILGLGIIYESLRLSKGQIPTRE